MKNDKLASKVKAALFAAVVCVASLTVQIALPATGGYINLGDCFVLVSAWVLGPVYGTLAAGIGSALADAFTGYFFYAPATLVIKSLMAFTGFWLFSLLHRKTGILPARIASALAAELVMLWGYFGYECIFYGLAAALAGAVGNAVQGAVGLVCAVVLTAFLQKIKIFGDDIELWIRK